MVTLIIFNVRVDKPVNLFILFFKTCLFLSQNFVNCILISSFTNSSIQNDSTKTLSDDIIQNCGTQIEMQIS